MVRWNLTRLIIIPLCSALGHARFQIVVINMMLLAGLSPSNGIENVELDMRMKSKHASL
jgi:hypothetical protein